MKTSKTGTSGFQKPELPVLLCFVGRARIAAHRTSPPPPAILATRAGHPRLPCRPLTPLLALRSDRPLPPQTQTLAPSPSPLTSPSELRPRRRFVVPGECRANSSLGEHLLPLLDLFPSSSGPRSGRAGPPASASARRRRSSSRRPVVAPLRSCRRR